MVVTIYINFFQKKDNYTHAECFVVCNVSFVYFYMNTPCINLKQTNFIVLFRGNERP